MNLTLPSALRSFSQFDSDVFKMYLNTFELNKGVLTSSYKMYDYVKDFFFNINDAVEIDCWNDVHWNLRHTPKCLIQLMLQNLGWFHPVREMILSFCDERELVRIYAYKEDLGDSNLYPCYIWEHEKVIVDYDFVRTSFVNYLDKCFHWVDDTHTVFKTDDGCQVYYHDIRDYVHAIDENGVMFITPYSDMLDFNPF